MTSSDILRPKTQQFRRDSQSSQKKSLILLGSTGSIGRQTLDVVRSHDDQLEVVALVAHRNASLLLEQAREFGVHTLVLGDESLAGDDTVAQLVTTSGLAKGEEAFNLGFGYDAIVEVIRSVDADIVVNALVGAAGLRASLETLLASKPLALANKESLVVGGDLIMPMAKDLSARLGITALLPIDSEHGAIFQCLQGESSKEVFRLWVTASGGPFRGMSPEALQEVTPDQALAHPTWSMGPKITIDSATLMNKGLEVIEAHHLFGLDYDFIEVVVQPQSLIHSMVEFIDGSVKAHLGTTDMRIPIQYALSFPERWSAPVSSLDFRTLSSITFDAPDEKTFRCLVLARQAGAQGGTLPCVMNGANEVAVASFLQGTLKFLDIASCVESVMDKHASESVQSFEQLQYWDEWARNQAQLWISTR